MRPASSRMVAICPTHSECGATGVDGMFSMGDAAAEHRRRRNPLHGGDKTVAAARKRFDEARILVRITQGAAERLDRCVYAVLEINEGVRRPQASLQFFACEQLAGLFQQEGENLEGPARQTNLSTVLAELAGAQVNMVGVES